MRSTDNPAGRFADWKGVIKKLSGMAGGACSATIQPREANGTALVLPAACLFSGGGAAPSDASRTALAAIAADVARVTDREFWIAAHGTGGAQAERINRARAEAVVAALIAGGVAPERLAALFGDPGFSDGNSPGKKSAGAVVEIVAAPRAFLSPPRPTDP